MKEIQIEWDEFVTRYKNQGINPWVDINKGHALMKAPFAPANWRLAVNILSTLTILSMPTAIILFFFVKWWIPILIIVLSLMTMKGVREEAAKAVIETSLKDKQFYSHAIMTGTMIIYSIE